MVILKDARRFECRVTERDGEWVARLFEYVPGRLYPTQHVLRRFATRQAAIEAVRRKWQVLFPDEPPLIWHDPKVQPSARYEHRPRRGPRREQRHDAG